MGDVRPSESLINAARRSFAEQTSYPAFGPFLHLTTAINRRGVAIQGWAFEATGELDSSDPATEIRSGWFDAESAKLRINPAQSGWIDEVVAEKRD